MDACHLDVLQDAAHEHVLAVAERIDVDFNGSFEESIKIDWVVRRDLRGFGHVLVKLVVVVDDGHAAAAEHVARTDEQREADVLGNPMRLFEGRGLTRSGVDNLELVEHLGETVAIFSEVDRLGARAHNGDARFLQGARELERRLAAECHDDAVGVFHIDDVHHIFEGQRLEIKLVGGVVVSRDRLGVAVDHDGLEAGVGKRVACMHAAVVELDALADAVRARAEDHRALLGLGSDLALASVVSLVVVGRFARRFGSTGVDRLERRDDAERLAVGAHGKLV